MATWRQIAEAIQGNRQDEVRRRLLGELAAMTGRPVISYAVEMLNQGKIQAAQGQIIIDYDDKVGIHEMLRNVTGNKLDVILRSPGGRPEVAETLVKMIRRRFSDVRFLVPDIAKSAATMMTTSGNEIILGDDAELGPTDPQFIISGGQGYKRSPAHAILQQFEKAKEEIGGDTKHLPAWLPIIEQYGPSLLVECEDAIALSRQLVTDWLKQYMFSGQERAGHKAANISRYLVSRKHLSHGRAVDIEELRRRGMNIKRASEISAEFAEKLQDIDYATQLTFQVTGAYKLFDNSRGEGFCRVVQQMQIPMPVAAVAPQPNARPQQPRGNPPA